MRFCPRLGARPCVTTTLHWFLKADADPLVQGVVDQVNKWCKVWKSLPNLRQVLVRKAWPVLLAKHLTTKGDWCKVQGLASATIAVLRSIGWKPVKPDAWINLVGDRIAVIDSTTKSGIGAVIRAVREDGIRAAWGGAADHFLGKGIEQNIPELGPAREARRTLIKEGNYLAARGLDATVTGVA